MNQLQTSSREKRRYQLFGAVLESEISFPELHESCGLPAWHFRMQTGQPPQGRLVGESDASGRLLRLFESHNGIICDYADTGSYFIAPTAKSILWYPGTRPDTEIARAIVLGVAVPIILQAAGMTCLHGSAVSLDNRVVGFVAPKYHGKSTLALACGILGAAVVADDLIAVDPTTFAVPFGTRNVRVLDDVVDQFAGCVHEEPRSGAKSIVHPLTRATLHSQGSLEAIYVLAPHARSDRITRRRLSSVNAAAALIEQSRLRAQLQPRSFLQSQLQGIGLVASSIPVYVLAFPRNLALLRRTAATVLRWHDSRCPSASISD